MRHPKLYGSPRRVDSWEIRSAYFFSCAISRTETRNYNLVRWRTKFAALRYCKRMHDCKVKTPYSPGCPWLFVASPCSQLTNKMVGVSHYVTWRRDDNIYACPSSSWHGNKADDREFPFVTVWCLDCRQGKCQINFVIVDQCWSIAISCWGNQQNVVFMYLHDVLGNKSRFSTNKICNIRSEENDENHGLIVHLQWSGVRLLFDNFRTTLSKFGETKPFFVPKNKARVLITLSFKKHHSAPLKKILDNCRGSLCPLMKKNTAKINISLNAALQTRKVVQPKGAKKKHEKL